MEALSAPGGETPAAPGPARALAVVLGLAAFSAAFVLLDQAYYSFVAARFPPVGTSALLATAWGLVSRAHLIVLAIPLVLWRPGLFGFQRGSTRSRVGLIGAMLVVNCGLVAAYLWFSGGGTPYSDNQWLVTETVTVPVIEDTFWRGLVFAALLHLYGRVYPPRASLRLTVWSGGIAFGLLHLGNALAGVPLAFVAVQSLSAVVWGILYGYARAQTGSVYPPMLLHAAMNLVVVLF